MGKHSYFHSLQGEIFELTAVQVGLRIARGVSTTARSPVEAVHLPVFAKKH